MIPRDNEVFLRGRLAAVPEVRALPSGDELLVFRINVRRPDGERTRVDSIDCASGSGQVRRIVGTAAAGDLIEVTGALHRRFWRSSAGLGSRYEVQVSAARVSRRPRTGA